MKEANPYNIYKESNPLVSVVIVAYNGYNYSKKCLEAVLSNSYSNYEVIFVNDGSSDGTSQMMNEFIKEKEQIKFLNFRENKGPALRRNQAIKIAKGDYIAFLDNDTKPRKDWLIEVIKIMSSDLLIGACQCKLLLMNDKRRFDYAGDYVSQYGFLVQKAEYGEIDNGQYDNLDEILSAKSAGMVVRTKVLNEVGLFDSDYFIYVEETDLCWRIWLGGYKVKFVPSSVVYHAFGGSSKSSSVNVQYRAKFHGCKNYIMTLVKNLEFDSLMRILPIHVLLWLSLACFLLLKLRLGEGCYIIRGILYSVIHLKSILEKRAHTQKMRKVSDSEIQRFIMRKSQLLYLIHKFTRGERMNRILMCGN